MNILKNKTGDIKIFALIYALLFVSYISYLTFSVLRNNQTDATSEIPVYSLDKINAVNKSLDERQEGEPMPERSLIETDFGKEEPFR